MNPVSSNLRRRNGYRRFRSLRALPGFLQAACFTCYLGLPVVGNAATQAGSVCRLNTLRPAWGPTAMR